MSAVRALASLLLVAPLLLGCPTSDSREAILEERARWQVEPLGLVVQPGGDVLVTARVSGPVRSALDRLTVRVVLRDGQGNDLASEWRTLDLTRVERGTPEEVTLVLPRPAQGAVEGVWIDTVPAPGADELPQIKELAPGA